MRFFTLALVLLLAGCGRLSAGTPGPLPTGHVGELASYGRELLVHTREHMAPFITANMDCGSCHIDAGTKPQGGSLVGIAGKFPEWNTRAHRVIALQDRIAECFLYSMNGHPPAYNSREMLALVSYITYLSRGTPIGSKPDPTLALAKFRPPQPPDVAHGSQLYAQKCAACHGAGGAGTEAFPALWGSKSFNGGAGMRRVDIMAEFVRYNMPQNAPGTLSNQDSYDVAAYVLSHERPKFKKSRLVMFPAQRAGYF